MSIGLPILEQSLSITHTKLYTFDSQGIELTIDLLHGPREGVSPEAKREGIKLLTKFCELRNKMHLAGGPQCFWPFLVGSIVVSQRKGIPNRPRGTLGTVVENSDAPGFGVARDDSWIQIKWETEKGPLLYDGIEWADSIGVLELHNFLSRPKETTQDSKVLKEKLIPELDIAAIEQEMQEAERQDRPPIFPGDKFPSETWEAALALRLEQRLDAQKRLVTCQGDLEIDLD